MGANAVGNLSIIVGANAVPFDREMGRISRDMAHLSINGGGMKAGMGGGAVVAGLAMGLNVATAAGSALLGVMEKIAETTFRLAADFELSAAKFAVLTGSKAIGDTLLENIQKLAIQTPFNAKDFTDISPRLLGSGVKPDVLIPVLSRLGDIAMGDAEKLRLLGLAYSQVMSKGRLMGQEVNLQFADAGVSIKNFADAAGLSVPMFLAEMEAGRMGADVMVKAINNMTTGTGKFAGMNAQMSGTVIGQWNAVSESIDYSLRKIGLKLFETFDVAPTLGRVADFAIGFQDRLSAINPYLEAGAKILNDAWGSGVVVFESLSAAIAKNHGKIDAFIPSIASVQTGFHNLTQGIISYGAQSLEVYAAVSEVISGYVIKPIAWATVAVLGLHARLADAIHLMRGGSGPSELGDFFRLGMLGAETSANKIVEAMELAGSIAKDWSSVLMSNLDGGARQIGKTIAEMQLFLMKQFSSEVVSSVVGPMAAFAPMQPKPNAIKPITIDPAIPPDVMQFANKLQSEMRQGVSPLAKFHEQERLANAAFMADLINPDQWEFAIGNAFEDLEKVFQKMSMTHLPKAMAKGTQAAESAISRAIANSSRGNDPMRNIERILEQAKLSERNQERYLKSIADGIGNLKLSTVGFNK